MAAPRWWVDSEDAFRRWTFNDRPSPLEKQSMLRWLEQLEQTGRPPIVGYSENGLPEARGPSGEIVEHDFLELPEEFAPTLGVIAVKEITSRH